MIKHVVMWQLKDTAEGMNKIQNREIIKEKLEGLKQKIQQIESLEVGFNFNPADIAYDVVLITTHPDKSALSAYAEHPAHKEVAGYIGNVVMKRTVVDFEY